jgi:hypothetical protein
MAESTLSLSNSSQFRNNLLSRNLQPYSVPGVFTSPYQNTPYEIVQTVDSVIDTPQISSLSNNFYPLNQYGPEGGFNDVITFNGPPLPTTPNQGEYNFTDTELPELGKFYLKTIYNKSNKWTPIGGYSFIYNIQESQLNNKVYQPYLPLYYTTSNYNAYDIVTQQNPQGSNGPLSSDSYLAQLGASSLKFHISINAGIATSTGIKNKTGLSYLTDPFSQSTDFNSGNISTANDFRITIPAAEDTYLNALAGTYFPSSPILGDYFSSPVRNIGTTGQLINVIAGASTLLGGLLSGVSNRFITPSQLFLEQTGSGQKSILFSNINYNIYRPAYGNSIAGGLFNNVGATALNSLAGVVGTQAPGTYYVGSSVIEPSYIASPLTDVPINAFGESVEAPVYGPTDLSELYEGNQSRLNFGLASKPGTNDNIDGNFVWTSPKYSPNAGKFAKPGGVAGKSDPAFNTNGVGTQYKKNESKSVTFKVGSILDDTQRLIDSADRVRGERRLKHVGNAINQVSKVFHDGYKEITKGSKVIAYTNTNGNLVGEEYARVFTKDSPYYTHARLQKSEGITNANRAFTYSVLDSPFNLNITPNKASEKTTSTNIIDGKVKKYMFSIENLAWRTTSLQFELPACEKGPNGGRIMWFPPYDLTYSETSNVDFPGTTFLGRPEPIYTYKNTSRTGQISFKIIVDYPSVLDVIAQKVLENEKDSNRIDSIINSFFAGCTKFDLYELAQKYPTIPINQLAFYQQKLNDPRLTKEELEKIKNAQQGANTSDATSSQKQTGDNSVVDLSSYETKGIFCDIAVPSSIGSMMDTYLNEVSIAQYASLSENPDQIKSFFSKISSDYSSFQELIGKLNDGLKDGKSDILIELESNLSPDEGTDAAIAESRFQKVVSFFTDFQLNQNGDQPITLDSYVKDQKLRFKNVGTASSVVNVDGTNCKDVIDPSASDAIRFYNLTPTACRSVIIKKITVQPKPDNAQNNNLPSNQAAPTADNPNGNTLTKPTSTTSLENIRPGIAKKIVRALLNEGDYFEAVKKDNPMIYDNLKEKLKYFNPSFHSMTPEGLNSRVTFLNQCVRPGQTIPTIVNGQPTQNVATNTAFGAPPVLVLRIGDFYNTKIIPTSLSIQPDQNTSYDLNPEGIGVQPMLLKVTLNFNYIGGSGLAEPIDELQNALTFNYYANTEIYDERATPTEDTSELDKKFVKKLLGDPPPKVEKPLTAQPNPGGTTIGVQSNIKTTSSGETGTLSYGKIMNSFVDETEKYYANTLNQLKSIYENYNLGIVQLTSLERQYTQGNFDEFVVPVNVNIYGKPDGLQDRIDGLFAKVIEDIDTGQNDIVDGFIQGGYGIDSPETRVLIQNLKTYLEKYKSDFPTELFNIIQTLTTQQQTWVQYVRKLNYVLTNSDGKITARNEPVIYNLSATTSNNLTDTYTDLKLDYDKIALDLNQYSENLISSLFLEDYDTTNYQYENQSMGLTQVQSRFYQVIVQVFIDRGKYDEFENQVLTEDINKGETKNIFNKKTDILKDLFRKQYKKDEDPFDQFTNDVYTAKYKKYKPFTTNKDRNFDYSSLPAGTDEQKSRLADIYKSVNVNEDKQTFDGKTTFN